MEIAGNSSDRPSSPSRFNNINILYFIIFLPLLLSPSYLSLSVTIPCLLIVPLLAHHNRLITTTNQLITTTTMQTRNTTTTWRRNMLPPALATPTSRKHAMSAADTTANKKT